MLMSYSEQIAMLKGTVAEQAEEIEQNKADMDKYLNQAIDMQDEIKRLKDALDIFGDHRVGCSFFIGQSVCNCGFDELMTAAPPQKEVNNNNEPKSPNKD